MKNAIRITALALVFVMMAALLASCGTTLSGTYKSDAILNSFTQLEFKGSKVVVKTFLAGNKVSELNATYKIKGDEITITYESDSDDKEAEKVEGTKTFKKDGDTIEIGGTKYTKQ